MYVCIVRLIIHFVLLLSFFLSFSFFVQFAIGSLLSDVGHGGWLLPLLANSKLESLTITSWILFSNRDIAQVLGWIDSF